MANSMQIWENGNSNLGDNEETTMSMQFWADGSFFNYIVPGSGTPAIARIQVLMCLGVGG